MMMEDVADNALVVAGNKQLPRPEDLEGMKQAEAADYMSLADMMWVAVVRMMMGSDSVQACYSALVAVAGDTAAALMQLQVEIGAELEVLVCAVGQDHQGFS